MISIIKLSNGETLLARVTFRDGNKMTVKEPLKLDIVEHFGGPAMITTFWVPFEEDNLSVDINMQHVIMSVEVPKDIRGFYTKSLSKVRGEVDKENIDQLKERVKKAMNTLTSNNRITLH